MSLELRWGTWGLRADRAENTSPSADRDLLIRQASLALCPSTPDRANRSLHATDTIVWCTKCGGIRACQARGSNTAVRQTSCRAASTS